MFNVISLLLSNMGTEIEFSEMLAECFTAANQMLTSIFVGSSIKSFKNICCDVAILI